MNPTGKIFVGRKPIRIYLGAPKPKWLKKGPFSKDNLINFNFGMGFNSSIRFVIKTFFVLNFFFLLVSSIWLIMNGSHSWCQSVCFPEAILRVSTKTTTRKKKCCSSNEQNSRTCTVFLYFVAKALLFRFWSGGRIIYLKWLKNEGFHARSCFIHIANYWSNKLTFMRDDLIIHFVCYFSVL